MSATNRGSVRAPRDFYRTPQWAVAAVLPHLPTSGRILEPGCGDGAIIRALIAHGVDVDNIHGVEIDATLADKARDTGAMVDEEDFIADYDPGYSPDLIIMNPPFSKALEFVKHARTLTPNVCALLPLSFMSSKRRADFHRANPSHAYVLPRRPSFTGKGTDAQDYAWMFFGAPSGWSVL